MGQAKSTPAWSVKQNNWLDTTNKFVKAESVATKGIKASVPIWPDPDPARGCPKEFTSLYKCSPGTTEKQVLIPAEAAGHWAQYDCSNEFMECAKGVLEINDNGEVILRNDDGSQIYWRSGPNKTGLAIETFSAVKSKYGRNYIKAGEGLGIGEWVGSPSGNCYLTVVSDGSTSQLVVAYQQLGCHPPRPGNAPPPPPVCKTEYKSLPNKNIASVILGGGGPENRYNYDNLEAAQQQCSTMDNCSGITRDGYGYNLRSGGPSPWTGMSSWQKEKVCTDPPAPTPEGLGKNGYVTTTAGKSAFYSMTAGSASNKYAGKVAYSDLNMHRREYPSSMVSRSQDFVEISGNFTQTEGIMNQLTSDFDGCKAECNKLDHCQGIIMNDGASSNNCTLLNSVYPNQNRLLDATGQNKLYASKVKVANPETCSSNMGTTFGATYANMVGGSNMTPKTKCSLGKMTAEQLKIVAAAEAKLEKATTGMVKDLNELNQQNATLDQDMLDQLDQLQKDSRTFDKVRKKTEVLQGEVQNAGGMEESTGLDMVSNNMHLVLWTALGAAAVIGSIKATK